MVQLKSGDPKKKWGCKLTVPQMERHQSWPHVSSSGPDGFIRLETRRLNATSLLPRPARPSQAALGVNKPLQTSAGSALHSSPQQVLASASISCRVIRNCLLFELLLSPEPQVTESWLYTQFIALLPPLNRSTGEQKCSWPQGRLLSLLQPFLQGSLNIF